MAEIQKSGLGLGLGLEPRPERDLATVINEDQPLDLQVVESGGGLGAGCLDGLIFSVGVTEDELRAQCLSAQARILKTVNAIKDHPPVGERPEKRLNDFGTTEEELARSFTVLEAGAPFLGVPAEDLLRTLYSHASIIAGFQ